MNKAASDIRAPGASGACARRNAPPRQLYETLRRVALAQPRTFAHAAYDERLQAHFVARSRVFNFPDLIAVQVTPESGLILWSRSVYGRGDFGVNRKRLQAWLAALGRRPAGKLRTLPHAHHRRVPARRLAADQALFTVSDERWSAPALWPSSWPCG